MAIIKQVVGTFTALTSTNFGTLASGTYCVSSEYNNTTNNPVDLMIEATAACTTGVAGNKKIDVFVIARFDATNYQSGPTSGTTTSDEPELTLIGSLPMFGTATARKAFSVAQQYGGVLPPFIKVVCKNDIGIALTSGSLATAEVSLTVI